MTVIEEVSDDEVDTQQQQQYAEDRAREAAVARRQRILQKSKDRLGLVEGTLPKEKLLETVATDTNAVAETVIQQDGDEVPSEGTTAPAPETKSKPTSAARMAAARRMRFKKSAASAESSTTTTSDQTVTTITTEETTPVAPTPSSESITALEEETKNLVASSGDDDTPEPVVEEPVIISDENVQVDSKKYQGVAKMRRRMIKEKQQRNGDDEGGSNGGSGGNNGTETPPALAKAKERVLQSMAKKRAITTSPFPLYMSVVTVLLLFLAGLDVGLHQGYIDYGLNKEMVRVHTELAPRQFGGRWQGALEGFLSSSSSMSSKFSARFLSRTDDASTVVGSVDDADEFETTATKLDEFKEKNIDPLFGIDLDELTAGDGLYFMAARFAVQCHRVNLAIFYYFPLNIYTTITSGIWQLFGTPPIFCLVALIIRQLIGKTLLGAKIPTLANDASKNDKDILSMAKSFASSFITKSFPTAVLLYDAFVHVRTDMYIVLCGFLVGVAYTHSTDGGFLAGWKSQQQQEAFIAGKDEL